MLRTSNYLLSVLLFISTHSAFAAPVVVVAPKKFNATLSGATYNQSFTHTQNNAQGVITVVNGDGSDLSPKDCKNLNALKTLICKAENIARALAVALLRPSAIEVSVNGQVLVTSTQLPAAAGKYQRSVVVNASNALKVKVKGSPLAFITVDIKAESQSVNQNPIADFTATPSTGVAPILISFSGLTSSDPDGTIVSYAWEFGDGGVSTDAIATHLYNTPGTFTVKLTVRDNQGATSVKTKSVVIIQDTVAPVLAIVSPIANSVIQNAPVVVTGSANERLSSVTAQLNGEPEYSLDLSADKTSFSGILSASFNGQRVLTVKAKDIAGNISSATVSFTYMNVLPPLAKLILRSGNQGTAPFMVLFDGTQSSDPQNQLLTYSWTFGDGETFTSTESGLTTHLYENAGTYTARLTVTNNSGISDSKTVEIIVNSLQLPPDPVIIAPPLAENTFTPFNESIAFIYSGSNPIQKDVARDVFDEKRVSIVRGKVFGADSRPLSGVKVTQIKSTGFGYTYTREDGTYDFAVNGGGKTTMQFEKPGHLPAQRSVEIGFRDYATTEDAFLIEADSKATVVENNSPVAQVAQGTIVTDSDGPRAAAVVIPANTEVQIELPNGGTMTLPSLTLRMSEYTVGENGPSRMPGSLPTTTSYTYAADVTADEALAMGAKHIKFSKPVSFYVDNFLNFASGTRVPTGVYDYDSARWKPLKDGRVIKVLEIQANKAIVDVSGSGVAATQAELTSLNIDEIELQKIAGLYAQGKSFWRTQVDRFSPIDLNWLSQGLGVPPVVQIPQNQPCEICGDLVQTGSIIHTASQTLSESIPIIGTDLNLTYSSGRVADSLSASALEISVTGGLISPELSSITLTVETAGQKYIRNFSPQPNLVHTYIWDGKDAYGREISGRVPSKVAITYHYPSTYFTALLASLNPETFGSLPVDLQNTLIQGRETSTTSSSFDTFVGRVPTIVSLAGGWNFPEYHSFDTENKIMYLGNGSMVGGQNPILTQNNRIIEVVAGDGTRGYSPDGTPASQSKLYSPHPITIGRDGSIYFSDAYPMIRKIKPDGTIQTIAGLGYSGYTGDGGPATQATFRSGLNSIQLVEGENQEYFIADIGNCVIRKIDSYGIISTVAGNGVCGFTGDNGPAINARLGTMFHLRYHEGSLFIAESNTLRVREITSSGIIRTVLGTGTSGFSPDGTPALQANITSPAGIGFTKDGELVFVEVDNHLIRKIDKLGRLVTLAGTPGQYGNSPDGTLATSAVITYPLDLKVRADGSIFYRDGVSEKIRYISSEGKLQTLVGAGGHGMSPTGTPVLQAKLGGIRQFDFAKNGDVYIVEQDNNRIIKITDPLKAKPTSQDTYQMASNDGTEIFVYDLKGKHISTLFSKTGAAKFTFEHSPTGDLSKIIDRAGNIVEIFRGSDRRISEIRGPFGHTTKLWTDTNGYLNRIELPNSKFYEMTSTNKGLLTSFTKPNGAKSVFNYDVVGRLSKDTDAVGGFTQLVKSVFGSYKRVNSSTAQGRNSELLYLQSSYSQDISYRSPANETTYTSSGDNFFSQVSPSGNFTSSTGFDFRTGATAALINYEYENRYSFEKVRRTQRTYSRLDSKFSFDMRDTTTNELGETLLTVDYSSNSKMYNSSTSLGRTTSLGLDNLERPVYLRAGSLSPKTIEYNSVGKISRVIQGDRENTYSYGTNGALETYIDAMGRSTKYSYDGNLQVEKKVLPNGLEILFSYDDNGNLKSVTPAGKPKHDLIYNAIDMLIGYLPPTLGGNTPPTTYSYNLDRQITSIQRPDAKQIVMTYSQFTGQLMNISTPEGNYTHTYNQGDLASKTSPDGIFTSYTFINKSPETENISGPINSSVSFGYNQIHKLSTLGLNGQNINFSYDKDEMLASAGAQSYQIDSSGLLRAAVLGGISETFTYNNFGENISTTATFGVNPIFQQSIERDKLGRITSNIENILGLSKSYSYTYDTNGRLAEVKLDGNIIGSYIYDSNGNRTSAYVRGRTSTSQYDSQDRLIQNNSNLFSYSLNGELSSNTNSLTNTVRNYVYDVFGNIKQASVGGKNISYVVDGANRRIAKKVNGLVTQGFVYIGKTQIIAEVDSNSNVLSRFIYGSKVHSPNYMIKNNVTYKVISDHVGSIRLVVNASTGQIAQEMNYDEFGNVLSDTNPGFQPFGFAGGLYDKDTGFVRFGARDYDAEVGRWTAKDPILFGGGSANLYSYSSNDPINFIDPSGLDSIYVSTSTGKMYWINDDGKVILTRDYKSGNSKHPRIPDGTYRGSNPRKRSTNGMTCDNQGDFGFSVDLDPAIPNGRTDLRIHPDGGPPGTLGCVGTSCSQPQSPLYDKFLDYFSSHSSITVEVGSGTPF